MTTQEKIEYIADYYGYEHQSRQCMEEMAELTVEICHLDERGNYQDFKHRQGIYEEIADVEVVLEQIKYLLNCEDEVEAMKTYKVRRQLERMGEKDGCERVY